MTVPPSAGPGRQSRAGTRGGTTPPGLGAEKDREEVVVGGGAELNPERAVGHAWVGPGET